MTNEECRERFDRTGERCTHGLTTQLIGLEGKRVQVTDTHGETRRFWVARSTGWVPCHIEVKTRRSLGGFPADQNYKSITVVQESR